MGGLSGLAAKRGGISALELERHGIVFEREAGIVQPFGPANRTDLRDRMKSEIELRTLQMQKLIEAVPANRSVPFFVVIAPAPTSRAGVCIMCGDPLAPHHGGQCALCSISLHKALIASKRLPE